MSDETTTLEAPVTVAAPAKPAVAKKKPAKKKPAKKPAPKPPVVNSVTAPDVPPIELPPIVLVRKEPQFHDQDRDRLLHMLRGKPISAKLEEAYFVKQRQYHQHLQGPLPIEMLADLLFDAEKISVFLPAMPQVAEDAGDRMVNPNR